MEQSNQYMAFLGSFVTNFSKLEWTMRQALKRLSGLDENAFRVLVGFPRTTELTEKLKKMAYNAKLLADEMDEVNRAFAQLTELVNLRDRAVHYGGHPIDTGEFIIRTKRTDISKVTNKAYDTFSLQDLNNAHFDCYIVEKIFFAFLYLDKTEPIRSNFMVSIWPPRPWHYKHPQPAKTKG